MFISFLVVMTLVWAVMFILPVIGYAALGMSLLKSTKTSDGVQNNRSKPVVRFVVSHA